jgi:hypothetical protein
MVGILNDHLDFLMAIWNIVEPIGYFVVIWCILPSFGTLHQEQSGNPGSHARELW